MPESGSKLRVRKQLAVQDTTNAANSIIANLTSNDLVVIHG